MRIRITIGEDVRVGASLWDTPTGRKIHAALPLDKEGSTWGEEIYFSVPVDLPLEGDAREVLEEGELGYWPDMPAFCLFYGPTPASRGDEIRAAGPVNVFGRMDKVPGGLRSCSGVVRVRVEREP